jgi:hypothetical protein
MSPICADDAPRLTPLKKRNVGGRHETVVLGSDADSVACCFANQLIGKRWVAAGADG